MYHQLKIEGGALRMAKKHQNKYLEYEREKQRLLEECTSVQEYQEKIAELCKRLNIYEG